MSTLIFSPLDLTMILLELINVMIIFAIIKGWIDNRRWEKHIYKILEQYRAKYGVDESCELLLYKETKKRVMWNDWKTI